MGLSELDNEKLLAIDEMGGNMSIESRKMLKIIRKKAHLLASAWAGKIKLMWNCRSYQNVESDNCGYFS